MRSQRDNGKTNEQGCETLPRPVWLSSGGYLGEGLERPGADLCVCL